MSVTIRVLAPAVTGEQRCHFLVQWRDSHAIQHGRTFATAAADFDAAVKAGKLPRDAPGRRAAVTFGTAATRWLATKQATKRPSTADLYATELRGHVPRTAVITLAGTLGIAALPPLNGFVSEWLIFQGLFQGFRTGSHLVGILIVLAAATLGLTGGLAIYAFVRGYGIPFLGMARTKPAAQASERRQPVAGPGLLAVACVALSVGAPIVALALSRAVGTVTGVVLRPVLLPGNLTIIPAHTDFSAFSPTWLAVFLVAVTAVPALIYLAGRPRADSVTVDVWDGGMVAFKPRMQYSAMTFSAPTRVTFDALYRPSVKLRRASDDPAGRPGPVHYETEVTPVFQRYLYQPVIRAVEWLADLVRPIQSGDVNLYLFYVFAMILLAYLIGAL